MRIYHLLFHAYKLWCRKWDRIVEITSDTVANDTGDDTDAFSTEQRPIASRLSLRKKPLDLDCRSATESLCYFVANRGCYLWSFTWWSKDWYLPVYLPDKRSSKVCKHGILLASPVIGDDEYLSNRRIQHLQAVHRSSSIRDEQGCILPSIFRNPGPTTSPASH
jgi:hypothetical protein